MIFEVVILQLVNYIVLLSLWKHFLFLTYNNQNLTCWGEPEDMDFVEAQDFLEQKPWDGQMQS